MQTQEDVRNLPIDITFSHLVEWLVDRKKIPADWRLRVAKIRIKIYKEFSSLPKDIDPYFQTLDPEVIGYLEAIKIYESLLKTTPESWNIFGCLSGSSNVWEAIVRAFEKDHIYLGEAAQIIIHNVNYEIPYLKKQVQKIQQQVFELGRKEADIRRSIVSTTKYEDTCRDLRLQGKNVRREILEAASGLPRTFKLILEAINSDSVLRAMKYYKAYVKDVHTKKDKHLTDSTTQDLGSGREKRKLLKTEHRNKILDDLYEVKAFLSQRLIELRNEDTMFLHHHVQAVSPLALHQYSLETIETMVVDISMAISLLTNDKSQDLNMILKFQRFLDKIVSELEEMKNCEVKLREGLKDVSKTLMELQNSLSAIRTKQEAALVKTRALKKLCETSLSSMFDGRPVNLRGEINTLLNSEISA